MKEVLLKHNYQWHDRSFDTGIKRVYYWYEDSNKKEIDFVIKPRNQPIAINVSYTDELPTREFEALKAFSKIATPEKSILVTKKHFERKTLNGKNHRTYTSVDLCF